MTDTTQVTSEVRPCANCGVPFGSKDKRYKKCPECRGEVETLTSPTPHVLTDEDSTLPMAGVEAIQLQIEKHKPPPPQERNFYWCGVTPDCPYTYLTLGGTAFNRTVGRVVTDEATGAQECRNDDAVGVINRLTEANVNLILEHAASKVIRNHRERIHRIGNASDPTGVNERKSWHGSIISTVGRQDRPYVPQRGDKPVGCFVYMIKVRHKTDRPMTNPPTMVPRDW